MKKAVVLILIISLSLGLTACFDSEDKLANEQEYTDNYLTLNYPQGWKKEVKGEGINKYVSWQETGSDFQFIIDFREPTPGEVKENPWEETIEKAQKFKSIEITGQKIVEVAGEAGKKLELEIKTPDLQIENLYYRLLELKKSYKELNNFLTRYKQANDFIIKIKTNPVKLDEIKTLLPKIDLKDPSFDPEYKEEKIVLGIIDAVKHQLETGREEKLKEQYISVSYEDIKLQIFFSSKQAEYDDKIEVVQKVIDSIKLKD